MRWIHAATLLSAAAILGLSQPAAAQKKPITQPLVAASVAGQSVALLPITWSSLSPPCPRASW